MLCFPEMFVFSRSQEWTRAPRPREFGPLMPKLSLWWTPFRLVLFSRRGDSVAVVVDGVAHVCCETLFRQVSGRKVNAPLPANNVPNAAGIYGRDYRADGTRGVLCCAALCCDVMYWQGDRGGLSMHSGVQRHGLPRGEARSGGDRARVRRDLPAGRQVRTSCVSTAAACTSFVRTRGDNSPRLNIHLQEITWQSWI